MTKKCDNRIFQVFIDLINGFNLQIWQNVEVNLIQISKIRLFTRLVTFQVWSHQYNSLEFVFKTLPIILELNQFAFAIWFHITLIYSLIYLLGLSLKRSVIVIEKIHSDKRWMEDFCSSYVYLTGPIAIGFRHFQVFNGFVLINCAD